MSELRDALPYGAMLNDHVMLLHGREGKIRAMAHNAFGIAWDISPRNLDVVSNEEADSLVGRLATLFHTLPVGATVDVRLDSRVTNRVPGWERAREGCAGEHVRWQREHIRSGMVHMQQFHEYRLRDNVVTLGVRLPCTSPLTPTLRHYLATFQVWRAQRVQDQFTHDVALHLKEDIDLFESRIRSFETSLAGMGFAPERLTGETLRRRLSRQLDPEAPDWDYEPTIPLREQVGYNHIKTNWHEVTVGDYTAAVLVPYRGILSTYPGVLSAARPAFKDTDGLVRAPVTLDIPRVVGDLPYAVSVSFTLTDAAEMLVAIESQHTYVSRHTTGLAGGKRQNVAAQEEEMGELLKTLSGHEEHLLPTGVKVIVWHRPAAGHIPNEVSERLSEVAHIIAPRERFIAGELYLQSLSLGCNPEYPPARQLGTMLPIPSTHTANLVPLWGAYRPKETPTTAAGMLLMNRLGDPVLLNPFSDTAAPHIVVTGATREGKSTFVNTLIHQMGPLGARAYILDIFGSYEDLANLHGGRHYRLSLTDPICLGLLDGPLDTQHRASALNTLAEIDRDGFSAEEAALLGLALEEWARTFKTHGEPQTLSGFVAALPRLTHLSPLAPVIFDHLSLRLRRYTGEGEFASLIDGPNEMQMDVPVLSVDIAEFKDLPVLRAVAVSLFLTRVLDIVSDPSLLSMRKFVIADEVAFLLANKETASYFLTLARALARFNCSLVTISQNLTDFLSTGGDEHAQTPGQVILSQSATRVTFRMYDSEMHAIPHNVIPPEQRQMLMQFNRSESAAEMIVRDASGEYGVVRVVPPTEFLIRMGQAPHHREARDRRDEGEAAD